MGGTPSGGVGLSEVQPGGATGIVLRALKRADLPAAGPIVFAIVRDEDYLLPHFLAHYRAQGVAGFLIYDDRSGPVTRTILMAQSDCAVVTSDHRFGDSFGEMANGAPIRLAQALKENLVDRLYPGRWVLTVDADEFLILPTGFSTLPQLTDHLDRAGHLCASAPLVDFYGETLADRNFPRDLSPFDGAPYFDVGPYYIWSDRTFPMALAGGVRFKLMRMLLDAAPDEVARTFPDGVPGPPKCWKTPLLKHGFGIRRHGDHELTAPPPADFWLCLAHFKFYPDLDAKLATALAEGQYFAGSAEYRLLEATLRVLGERSLKTWETRRYDGPASLERASLLRSPSRTTTASV